MALTLRAAKGDLLTHAEADENFSHFERVALSSRNYSLAADYNTAKALLTGSTAVPANLEIIGASGEPGLIGRGEATFSGTVNRYTIFGYNAANDGASIPNTAVSSIMWAFEADYNDGSLRQAEAHLNIAAPGGSYKRPFFSAMALTGGNAGKIVNTSILADININLYGERVNIEASAIATQGAQLHMTSLDTGGKDWTLYSSGSGLALGAGHMLLYNTTNSRYGLILPALGGVVAGDLAALATTATDGFLYVPTCAGAPTGVPTAFTGKAPIVVDTTNNKLYFRSGGAWRDAGP